MVLAARTLYQKQGFAGTAFSDVLEKTGAPRGSVYFHFPGGKDQLAREVVELHRAATLGWLDRLASASSSADELLGGFLRAARDRLVHMEFREGCAIAAVVVESPLGTTELADTAETALTVIGDHLTSLLIALGETEERARGRAVATLVAYEGALIVARATRNTEAFDAIITAFEV